MLFGERLNQVRKHKKISQESLAKSVGVHAPVIGRYERGEVKPSIEMAVKLAKALNVSLDYLTGNSDLELDSSIIDKVLQVQKLPEQDKDHFFYMMEMLIRDANARKNYA